jgi:hypothetical protein
MPDLTLRFWDVDEDLTSERQSEYRQLVIDALVEYQVTGHSILTDDQKEMIKELIKE